MGSLPNPPQLAGKSAEEYLLRREDQTLSAFQSHTATVGNTLLAAYILWILPTAEVQEKSKELFQDKQLLQLLLMCAVYMHITYNIYVIGSLTKRLYYHATKIAQNPNAKILKADSTRLLQPGPLGILQWASVRTAKSIANRKSGRVLFLLRFTGGMCVVALMVTLLLAPLIGTVFAYSNRWTVAFAAALIPSFQGIRLFFRYSRPYVFEIRGQAGAILRPAFEWFSDFFDRRSIWDDDPEDLPSNRT